MRPSPWDLDHITIMNGSVVPECLHRQTSPYLTTNCFLWWWFPMHGAPSGLGDRFFFGQITWLLYTSCLPGRRRSRTLCVFSVIYSLLLHGLTLLSLHRISPTFITILLMLFPAFTGRTSGVWLSRHNFTQLQLLLNSGSS